MNIPEQGKFMCRSCGVKAGLQPVAGAVWHYATCIRCRYKNAVTEQVRPQQDKVAA